MEEIKNISGKRVMTFGLHPDCVDYSKYPGVTKEMIENGLLGDIKKLNDTGLIAANTFLDPNTAETTIRDVLSKNSYDFVLIGAGVRNDPSHFLLFEKAVNIIHELQPQAKICFNTKPNDTLDAILRWS